MTATPKSYLEYITSTQDAKAAYAEGSLIADVHLLLNMAFEDSKLTYQAVGGRIGVSKARAHQLLCGDDNLTLKTMASLASALDCVWHFGLDDLRSGEPRFGLPAIRRPGEAQTWERDPRWVAAVSTSAEENDPSYAVAA